MKIITNKRQKELDAMTIKKLRFVAFATLKGLYQDGYIKDNIPQGIIKLVEDRAEQVFYADNVI